MIATTLQVAAGGAIGAAARYLVNTMATRTFGPGFPAGTLIVNVLGSFLMGALVVYLARRQSLALAPILMTGVLGGFTTFSAFSLDVATLYERGEFGLAAVYAVASLVLSVGALFAALWLMRGWLA
ncbi:MAG: fluoride efflux transporter CrcB [Pseudomonadota bacterium]